MAKVTTEIQEQYRKQINGKLSKQRQNWIESGIFFLLNVYLLCRSISKKQFFKQAGTFPALALNNVTHEN